VAPTSVLDASALLAYAHDEPGAEVVEDALTNGAAMSLVNWAEVLTVIVRAGRSLTEFERRLTDAGVLGPEGLLALVALTSADARLAAELYLQTSVAGLSLGDRVCYATGLRLRLPIFTAERAWPALAIPGAVVRLIRP
jgi:ribonuclease VapC